MEIDNRIGNENIVLRDRALVTKQELWNTAKYSIFKSIFG